MGDQQRTIHDICNAVGLSHGPCQQILSVGFNIWHTAAESVPRVLSTDQKEYRIAVCTELKEQAENNPNFISTIFTDDKFWVFGYDPKMKQQ
jgi:hypothetical protein